MEMQTGLDTQTDNMETQTESSTGESFSTADLADMKMNYLLNLHLTECFPNFGSVPSGS